MIEKHSKISKSLRIAMFLLLVIFLAVVIYLNWFELKNLRKSELDREQGSLAARAETIDDSLSTNAIFFRNLLVNNSDVSKLRLASDHAERLYLLQDIKSRLEEYLILDKGMSHVFFCVPQLGEEGYLLARTDSAEKKEPLTDEIDYFLNEYEKNGRKEGWELVLKSDRYYLFYITERNGFFSGCWCSADEATERIASRDADNRTYLLIDGSGLSLSRKTMPGQVLDPEKESFSQDGKTYYQLFEPSSVTGLTLVEILERSTAEASLIRGRTIAITVCILVFAGLMLFTIGLERFAIGPLRKLELAEYEQRLKNQEVQLEYYQMQIHPHFLVNALNNACTSIDMDQPGAARKMCMYLAKYYRESYSNTNRQIPLGKELEHVELYIQIMQMRLPGKVFYECEVSPDCRDRMIPPLSVLTFVENNVKYGRNPEDETGRVSIRAEREGQNLKILIRDNGTGFPEDFFEAQADEQPIERNGRRCVGVYNTVKRLKMNYEGAGVRFYNDHGACVEIRIPFSERS